MTEDGHQHRLPEDPRAAPPGLTQGGNGDRPLSNGPRRRCPFRRHSPRRGGHSYNAPEELKTTEGIAIADKREDLRAKESRRRWREAKDRLALRTGYLGLVLTVPSMVILWILLFTHPSAAPIALGGFGTGGGIALGYFGRKPDKSKDDSSSDSRD